MVTRYETGLKHSRRLASPPSTSCDSLPGAKKRFSRVDKNYFSGSSTDQDLDAGASVKPMHSNISAYGRSHRSTLTPFFRGRDLGLNKEMHGGRVKLRISSTRNLYMWCSIPLLTAHLKPSEWGNTEHIRAILGLFTAKPVA